MSYRQPQPYGRIPAQVSFDRFKDALLRRVDEDLVQNVYGRLKENEVLSNDGWKGMDADHEEEEVFAPLVDGFNVALDILSNETGKEKQIRFSNTYSRPIKMEHQPDTYKSDMAVLFTETTAFGKEAEGQHDNERNVVMLGEYDKCGSRWCTDDNIARLVGNVRGLLGSDPTRRFTYGLTIEDTDLRVWFFSRSHVYVTEALDIHQDAKALVYFVLALGSSSKAELGFDPTVQRVPYGPAKKPAYRFSIGGDQYQAVQSIREWKSHFILGCASRIYRVRRVLPNGELSEVVEVMKDLWIPEGITTEYELRQAIKADINKVNPVEGLDPQAFDRYFVKIEKSEFVQVPSTLDPELLVNDSSTNFLRDSSPPEHEMLSLQCTSSASRRDSDLRSPTSTPEYACERVGDWDDYDSRDQWQADTEFLRGLTREQYKNMVHCRILMEDAGRSLLKVRNVRTFIVCIVQAVTALMFMYSAGFVHRDISSGNILVSEKNGEIICKLCDIETAKEINTENGYPSRDIKVGTQVYMALEVGDGHWCFQPSLPRLKVTPHKLIARPRLLEEWEQCREQPLYKRKNVRYNYLHDLESLFWISMHFLAIVHAKDEDLNSRTAEDHQLYIERQLLRVRSFSFASDHILRRHISSRLDGVYLYLHYIAGILKEEYERIENTPSETTLDVSLDVYRRLQSWLDDLLACDSPQIWLGDVVSMMESVSAGQKRKASESPDLEDASTKKPKHHSGGS
ncbi:hypothetical protein VNI00_008638 [Paramarasmius palmivorus]|uniref:Protein kinase domain-containing protein n=1 Tax=Paramarasmius palmivorus TaxID=297713 RepID=A0AAW0CT45_9AGAR